MSARRWLLAVLVAWLLPGDSMAQDAAQPPQVVVLRHHSAPAGSAVDTWVEGFRRRLAERGYVEGRNVVVDYRWTDNNADKLKAIAAEVAEQEPAVVVAHGEAAIRALRGASDRLFIVVAVTGDLVGVGHAASLARPGGNVTGLIDVSDDLSAKRLQIATELLPQASRMAILWNAGNRVKALDFRETEQAARTLRLDARSFPVRQRSDFEPALATMHAAGVGAVLVLHDALTIQKAKAIVVLAAQAGMPIISGAREFADAGALVTYGANIVDSWRRAAGYVDKILKGAKPADLPIEQPTLFELVVNLKTAKALGIAVPQSILFAADAVIE